MTPYRKVTLSQLSPKARSFIISTMLALGFFLLFVSTFFFAYLIPHLDSEIFELNGRITDSDIVSTQMQLLQQSHWLPYNLVKMLDLNPNPPPQVKQKLTRDMKINMMTLLSLLCWPQTPTTEQQAAWQAMNFIDMENVKQTLAQTYIVRTQQLRDQRAEKGDRKQSILLWSTLCQTLGLTLTGIAGALQALRK